MALESKLQSKIRQDLEKQGWYVLKVIRCNLSGHPDINAFRNTKAIFIEVKAKGKKAEPLQLFRHDELEKRGFQTFIIDTWEQYLQLKPNFFK